MEEIKLNNSDPNIKVIKLTGDNLIPGEKEFDIDASNNPQLNFSKIDKTNAKNESNSNISDLEEITLDIPNDVDIEPNKNIDVEDGNLLEIDLNKEESDQLESQNGGQTR